MNGGRAWLRRALCALGMAWTAPNTAIGLIAARGRAPPFTGIAPPTTMRS